MTTLREAAEKALGALKDLNALVWGECSSLLNEDSGGNSALAIEIEEAVTALTAALAVQPQAEREGWKLVPLVPTQAIIDAAKNGPPDYRFRDIDDQVNAAYCRMLAAAPSAPAHEADAGEAPNGWRVKSGTVGIGEKFARWVCIRESQSWRYFYEDRDPLIFAFLFALSQPAPKEPQT